MTRNDRVFAPKYTSKVILAPMVVLTPPPPQSGVFMVVPNSLIERSKGTSSSTVEATISKGKEIVKEQEQFIVEEGQEFLKLIKKSDF